MADLIAQGLEFTQRWRRTLPHKQPLTVGRLAGIWSTPWDDRISRQHIEIRWNGKTLHVAQIPTARNPVFVHGQRATDFELQPGEHFVIGNTTFSLSGDRPQVTLDVPKPDHEQTFSAAELRRVSFRNAAERIELLSRLPEVIKGAGTDSELFVRLVNLLLAGTPPDAAALVAAGGSESPIGMAATDPPTPPATTVKVPDEKGALAKHAASGKSATPENDSASIRILHWDGRRLAGGNFQPSQKLIQQSLAKRETVLHTWTGSQGANSPNRKASIGPFAHHCPARRVAAGHCTLPGALVTAHLAARLLRSLRCARRHQIHRTRRGHAQQFARAESPGPATGGFEPILRAGGHGSLGDR